MIQAEPRPEGWTILEAIEQTVDPALVQDWRTAEAEWRSSGAPKRIQYLRSETAYGREVRHVNDRIREQNAILRRTHAARWNVLRALKELLSENELVGWGRFGSRVEDIRPIPASAWMGLDMILAESMLVERSKNKLQIYNVRIFRRDAAPSSVPLFHVKPTDSHAVPSRPADQGKKRRSPVAEQVAAALNSKGLDGGPSGHTIKAISKMIAPMMKQPPKTEDANRALCKAIARHYQRLRMR
jgi:hypothetical protein